MTFKALEPRKLPPSRRNEDVYSLVVLLTMVAGALTMLVAEMVEGAPKGVILGLFVGVLGLISVIWLLISAPNRGSR